MLLPQVCDDVNRLYFQQYGRRSVCNNYEIEAILDFTAVYSKILILMKDRRGHPSPRAYTPYRNLPRIQELDDMPKFKRFEQFSEEVRGKALAVLQQRGIYSWQPGFDQNSLEVREVCDAVETGRAFEEKPIKCLYKYTPDMLEELEARRKIMR